MKYKEINEKVKIKVGDEVMIGTTKSKVVDIKGNSAIVKPLSGKYKIKGKTQDDLEMPLKELEDLMDW
jgi:hypothetical protein